MNRFSATLILLFTPCLAPAQTAVLEVPELFGECMMQYASISDTLTLYRSPDLESQKIQINYGTGWLLHDGAQTKNAGVLC
jgi:hypothetical protein